MPNGQTERTVRCQSQPCARLQNEAAWLPGCHVEALASRSQVAIGEAKSPHPRKVRLAVFPISSSALPQFLPGATLSIQIFTGIVSCLTFLLSVNAYFMDADRPDHLLWARKGLRILEFVLGLTVCGLYAAGARAGCERCVFAVTVATLSVLTVVGAAITSFWGGRRTVLFLWEAILW